MGRSSEVPCKGTEGPSLETKDLRRLRQFLQAGSLLYSIALYTKRISHLQYCYDNQGQQDLPGFSRKDQEY
jgi:hypothetical protein